MDSYEITSNIIPNILEEYSICCFYPKEREQRLPIIAWEANRDKAYPVSYEILPPIWCLDNGATFEFPDDRTFYTFEDAEAYAQELYRKQQQHDDPQSLDHP